VDEERRHPAALTGTTMPLYDFHCRACGQAFEALVRPGSAPACPSCASADLERQLSTFAVSSSERSQQMAAAKVKKDTTVGRRDRGAMDREIEQHRKEEH
jgi:putative FmdB family regulatory protein